MFGEVPIDNVRADVDVAVWRSRRDGQEEWLVARQCIAQEAKGLLSNEVGGVLSLIRYWLLPIPCKGRIEILISKWVEQKL